MDSDQRSGLFTEEHLAFRDLCREFVDSEITPHHALWEEQGSVPRDIWERAGKVGLLGMQVPEEYGGPGVDDYRFNVIVGEELARAGTTGPGFVLHTDVVVPYILDHGTPDQCRRWLPPMVQGTSIAAIAMTEPATGSDLAAVQTTATPRGDGFVLSGQKTFITNGLLADLIVVVAKTDPTGGHRGISLLVVEEGMKGFSRGRKLQKIGMHAQDTSELFFDDVFVPRDNLLGKPGEGFLYLMQHLPQERMALAVNAVASAEAVFQTTLDYVQERHAFGQTIGSFQNTRFEMADMATQLRVARVFVDDCIRRHTAGHLTAIEAAGAKLWTTNLQNDIVDRCLQLHGGYGYMSEYHVARAFVDARVQKIYAGTNEIMKEIVGRSLGL